MKVLLITKNFPPLLGGASIVYEQLQRHFGPDLAILTAPTERLPPSSIGPEIVRLSFSFFETHRFDNFNQIFKAAPFHSGSLLESNRRCCACTEDCL